MAKKTIFDKLNAVFNKEELSKEDFGRDGFMLLRFLSMEEKYAVSINNVQRFQGPLGHRLIILLQHMFADAEKAPFLSYIKKEASIGNALSPTSQECLCKLFNVSKKRLKEYLPNLWVSDDQVKEVWGIS